MLHHSFDKERLYLLSVAVEQFIILGQYFIERVSVIINYVWLISGHSSDSGASQVTVILELFGHLCCAQLPVVAR